MLPATSWTGRMTSAKLKLGEFACPCLRGQPTAIHFQVSTGDVAGFIQCEEHRSIGNILRVTPAAHGRFLAPILLGVSSLCRIHWGIDRSRRDSVACNPHE